MVGGGLWKNKGVIVLLFLLLLCVCATGVGWQWMDIIKLEATQYKDRTAFNLFIYFLLEDVLHTMNWWSNN